MYVDIEVYRGDDNIFVAACPELNLFTHAKSQKAAVKKLKKNIRDFFTNQDDLEDAKREIEETAHFYSSRVPQSH
ncbi:MAG: hypothetical protein Q7S42_03680 [Candidatus Omnitrophota bacterium]|nr:hypothetical protein [Candidatus Omnitrophota bacterium]